MKMSRLLAISLLCLPAQPALADWENTHWGMSKDEFLSKTSNLMTDTKVVIDNGGMLSLSSSVEMDGFKFEGTILCQGNHLRTVGFELLKPNENNCTRLRDLLLTRFGKVEPERLEISEPRLPTLKVESYTWNRDDKIVFYWIHPATNQPRERCAFSHTDPKN